MSVGVLFTIIHMRILQKIKNTPNSGVSRYTKYAFWQPCCRNMPTLMVLHFPKSIHRIPCPLKHGSRSLTNDCSLTMRVSWQLAVVGQGIFKW